MGRIWVAATMAVCGCVGSMVRAPKQIPADGNVECTDTMGAPVAEAVVAVVSAGVLAYAMSDPEWTINHGGVLLPSTLATLSSSTLIGAGLGHSYALECRAAKRRGAELAAVARRKASARAEAGALWKRGAAAARADDCATVRELDPQIFELDVEFHAVVFARDVAIARCLAGPK